MSETPKKNIVNNNPVQNTVQGPSHGAMLEEEESVKLPLPGLSYFGKVLLRNMLHIIVAIGLFGCLGIFLGMNHKFEYKSEVIARYDSTLSALPEPKERRKTSFLVLSQIVEKDVESDNFLAALARRMEESEEPQETSALKQKMKSVLSMVLPKEIIPETWNLSPKELYRLSIFTRYRTNLHLKVDKKSNRIAIEAKGESVKAAQKLAVNAMNLLIERMLGIYIRKANLSITLWNNLLDADRKKRQTYAGFDHEYEDEPGPRLYRHEINQLKQRESELIERYLKHNEVTATKEATLLEQITLLKSDLETLLLTKGIHHPKVVILNNKLKKMEAQAGKKRDNKKTNALLKELFEVQSKLKASGIRIDLRLANMQAGYNSSELTATTEAQIRKMEIESENLVWQLKNPDDRNRIRITFGPTEESTPTNGIVLVVKVIAGFMGGIVVSIIIMIVRELISKRARDPWRIGWKLKAPLLGEFSRGDLKRAGFLNGQLIHELNDSLSRNQRKSPADLNVYSKLRLIQETLALEAGSKVLVITVADNKHVQCLVKNLANVLGSDAPGRAMLVDFDQKYPLKRDGSEGGIYRALTEDCDWRTQVEPPNRDRAFHFVPSGRTKSHLGLFGSEDFSKSLQEMNDEYPIFLYRALTPRFSVENIQLIKQATDILVVVGVDKAKTDEVSNLSRYLDASKMRGLITIS